MTGVKAGTDQSLSRHYWAVVCFAAALYVGTVAPGMLWQDSGMAQIRVITADFTGELGLALAHPLYYIVAQGFQLLPFANSAFKTNLVSAICGAFAVANVFLLMVLMLEGHRFRLAASLLAAGSLAVAHTFWFHSVTAETYTLSAMILTFELVLMFHFAKSFRLTWLLGAFMLNGLECSNHLLATLTLAAMIVWCARLIHKKAFPAWWLLAAMGCWFVGNLPYEILGIRALTSGHTVGQVVSSMLFGNYQRQVLNVYITPKLILTSLSAIVLSFATPNVVLIPLGMVRGRRFLRRRFVGLVGWCTLFHLGFVCRYNVADQQTFFVLPAVFLSIWLGVGAAYLLDKRRHRLLLPALAVFAVLPIGVYAILPAAVDRLGINIGYSSAIPYRNESRYFLRPWKTGYVGAQHFARTVFSQLPPRSIVIADNTSRHPLEYLQLTENSRPDVYVAFHITPQGPEESRIAEVRRLLRSQPIFVVRPTPGNCPKYILDAFDFVQEGLVHRIVERGKDSL